MKACVAAVCLMASPCAAQTVLPCDWQARADAIVEPWEVNSRTFGNGTVRVALLDVIEPAAGAYYLLVLSPPYDELGARQCRVIGFDGGTGFAYLDFGTLDAEYDPARGLILQLLGRLYDAEHDFSNALNLWVIVNQSNGEISSFMELGAE